MSHGVPPSGSSPLRRRVCIAGAVLLLGCGKDEAAMPAPTSAKRTAAPAIAELPLERVPVDARPSAGSPRLTAGPGGVVLSWLEPHAEGYRLRARRWGEDGESQTVVAHAELLENWADVPSVIPGPSGWVAGWPQRRGESGYDLQWSRQLADGSWTSPLPVSDAAQGPEFGFLSWATNPAGNLTAFWLDGRASTTSHGGAMQLWSATVSEHGVSERRVVDTRVCDCCQTAAAPTSSGPVVVYRDRDDHEVRDIWLAGPGPTQRRRVGVDDWRIEGCPVNGPSVSALGDSLAVAWFSGASASGSVRVAFAGADDSFSEPVVVDDGHPLGRVDLAWVDSESVAVVWIEHVDDAAEVRIRRVNQAGEVSAPMRVALTEPSRRSGFPHLERVGSELALTWVDLSGAAPTVAAAKASIAGLAQSMPRRLK